MKQTVAGRDLARARGLGRACSVASVGGAVQARVPMRAERSEAWGAEHERSAITHAAQVQFGELCI
eukprot:6210683-Pleurochrysis_carterae.AAC.1